MIGPHIEYNHDFPRFESLVRSINRPGDYYVAGRIQGVLPTISVAKVGTIAFPVLDAQIRSLIEASQPAPYGRGPDTVLDPSVRDCRQIDARRLRLSGKGWEQTLHSILDSVADGLGCDRQALGARLYKLLVYEPGGFFAEHRDTEKVDGMIATLVISLPTRGQGGEIVIRHQNREATVDMQVEEPGELTYAAFYADCVHLTKPIEHGHRVALVYNVVRKPRNRSAIPKVPDYSSQVDEIAELLSEWSRSEGKPRKIVWLLGHRYSEVALGQPALKGLDEAVERTLGLAAERSGCVLRRALLSIEESGGPDYDDIDARWHSPEIDVSDRICSMEDVVESSYILGSWSGSDLTGSELPEIPMVEGEALPCNCLDGAEPDKQILLEASGNEGASLERSYRLAAIVLWPRAREAAVIADGLMDDAIEYVDRMLDQGVADEGAPATASELVANLIDAWPGGQQLLSPWGWGVFQPMSNEIVASMLGLLARVGDETLIVRFLRDAVAKEFKDCKKSEVNGPPIEGLLVPFLLGVSPSTLEQFLPVFMRTNIPQCADDALALLARLRESEPAASTSERNRAFRLAAHAAFESLPEAFSPSLPAGQSEWRRPKPQKLAAEALRDLFAASHGLVADSEAEHVAALLASHPDQADPHRTVPKALAETGEQIPGFSSTPAFGSLWHLSARCLLDRSAEPPKAPVDERIEASINCQCNLCEELQAFCDDRQEKTKRFRVAQFNRDHIERAILNSSLDIDCRTEKRSRPHTLVCTKNRRSYLHRCEVHVEDLEHMRLLAVSAPTRSDPQVAPVMARLHEAMARK